MENISTYRNIKVNYSKYQFFTKKALFRPLFAFSLIFNPLNSGIMPVIKKLPGLAYSPEVMPAHRAVTYLLDIRAESSQIQNNIFNVRFDPCLENGTASDKTIDSHRTRVINYDICHISFPLEDLDLRENTPR